MQFTAGSFQNDSSKNLGCLQAGLCCITGIVNRKRHVNGMKQTEEGQKCCKKTIVLYTSTHYRLWDVTWSKMSWVVLAYNPKP